MVEVCQGYECVFLKMQEFGGGHLHHYGGHSNVWTFHGNNNVATPSFGFHGKIQDLKIPTQTAAI